MIKIFHFSYQFQFDLIIILNAITLIKDKLSYIKSMEIIGITNKSVDSLLFLLVVH